MSRRWVECFRGLRRGSSSGRRLVARGLAVIRPAGNRRPGPSAGRTPIAPGRRYVRAASTRRRRWPASPLHSRRRIARWRLEDASRPLKYRGITKPPVSTAQRCHRLATPVGTRPRVGNLIPEIQHPNLSLSLGDAQPRQSRRYRRPASHLDVDLAFATASRIASHRLSGQFLCSARVSVCRF